MGNIILEHIIFIYIFINIYSDTCIGTENVAINEYNIWKIINEWERGVKSEREIEGYEREK